MTKEQIEEHIYDLKKRGKVISNFYQGQLEGQRDYLCKCTQNSMIYVIQGKAIAKLTFFFVDSHDGINELKKLLNDYLVGGKVEKCAVEWFQKGTVDEKFEIIEEDYDNSQLREILADSNLYLYKKYVRITTAYKSNPMQIPECGRRKILYDMYEPMGEYPTLEDAMELCRLCSETFDPITDDVFTIDEWKEIINRKECLVYRNGGDIIAFYVWKIQGKTLYSNISLNKGPANYLYNMERRVFEYYWDAGIVSYYAWFDVKNKKALNRHNPRECVCIKNRTVLYNYIYQNKIGE